MEIVNVKQYKQDRDPYVEFEVKNDTNDFVVRIVYYNYDFIREVYDTQGSSIKWTDALRTLSREDRLTLDNYMNYQENLLHEFDHGGM